MITCPVCKAEIENDSWYCDQCGFKLKFCKRCGLPGKGNRCTKCGDVMYSPADEAEAQRQAAEAAPMDNGQESAMPQLYLVNNNLHIELRGEDGAVIGRRKGPYKDLLAPFSYISSTHASLHYSPSAGWTVRDMNSTNGSKLNHEKLIPDVPMPLRNGDRLQLANVELIIELRK